MLTGGHAGCELIVRHPLKRCISGVCVHAHMFTYVCVHVYTASSRDDMIYVMERWEKVLPRMNLKRILEFKQR